MTCVSEEGEDCDMSAGERGAVFRSGTIRRAKGRHLATEPLNLNLTQALHHNDTLVFNCWNGSGPLLSVDDKNSTLAFYGHIFIIWTALLF